MTATEGARALVNALRAKADPYKDNTLLDAADLIERLTTPPTDDEREALAQDIRIVDGSHSLGAAALADALVERGWGRRQGPITDADESDRQQIEAWQVIATHPFFEDCYDTNGTLIAAMLAKLTATTARDA